MDNPNMDFEKASSKKSDSESSGSDKIFNEILEFLGNHVEKNLNSHKSSDGKIIRKTQGRRNSSKTGKLYEGEEGNWAIAANVFERLVLRHVMLKKMEELEENYRVYDSFGRNTRNDKNTFEYYNYGRRNAHGESDVNGGEKQNFDEKIRAYRLATTDLFVEKAIAYLEVDYKIYSKHGNMLFLMGFVSIFIGFAVSGYIFFGADLLHEEKTRLHCIVALFKLLKGGKSDWFDFTRNFVAGFTFYGLDVLFAVGCWRVGRAMMDQAERLRERRHSLRQGRLFIHLNNGIVTVEELEKAFDWNVSKGNAFANIQTEASAPWGGIFKEIIKVIPEFLKKTKDAGRGA